MNSDEYSAALRMALEDVSTSLVHKWRKLISVLPPETKSVSVIISPPQDGDGSFDIFVSLSGPDLYVLNKKIEDHYLLFSQERTKNGFVPYVPFADSFEVDFEVNDKIADTVLPWLEKLWPQVREESLAVPIGIYVHDDYGSRSSAQLK